MEDRTNVIYSDKGLAPWEAACTWVEGETVTIQLREHFKKHKRFLGIYSKDEILAHELVHAARASMDEPIFEEILAYRTSKSAFRRYFGPLFRNPKESGIAVLALGLSLLSFWWPGVQLALLLAVLGGFGLLLTRLMRNQRRFAKALKKLTSVSSEEKAAEMLIRMTDQEIISLSKK